MDDVIALFTSNYFIIGARLSVVALAVGWIVWAFVRSRIRVLPIVGVLIAGALIATIATIEDTLDPAILPGLGLIALGVIVAKLLDAQPIVQALASAPGALWIAFQTDVTELVWVRVAFAVLIPLGGYLVNDFELRHSGLGLGVIFYALATLGVFGAVPDTEWAVTLFGVSWIVLFLAWPKVVASLGPVGSFLAVAVLMWVSAHGGAPRNASIVGAIACLGLLLLEPIIIRLNPAAIRVARSVRRGWVGAIVASIPQFLVVLLCSRIAARFTSEIPALVIVALIYGSVVTIGVVNGSGASDSDQMA